MLKWTMRWGTVWLTIPAVTFTLWGFRVEIGKALEGRLAQDAAAIAEPVPEQQILPELTTEGNEWAITVQVG